MWSEVILVSLVGALLSLDRTAAFQFMISRPLVTGPIIGLLLGQTMIGVVVGGCLELLWINRLPLGGQIPPNECLAAVTITAAIILAGGEQVAGNRPLIALGLLMGLPLGRLAIRFELQLRKINGFLGRRALFAVTSGRPDRLTSYNLAALGLSFLISLVFLLLFIPMLTLMIDIVQRFLPSQLIKPLVWMYFLLPLVGVATAFSNINVKRAPVIFVLCLLAALIWVGL